MDDEESTDEDFEENNKRKFALENNDLIKKTKKNES